MNLIEKNITYIREYLKSKYGSVKPEWNTIILLLEDNLDLYLRCKASLDANGIYDSDTGRKNPLLSTLKDLQATILKLIQHLGLSPYAVSKIKDDKEDDTDDFLEDLIN